MSMTSGYRSGDDNARNELEFYTPIMETSSKLWINCLDLDKLSR